MDNRLTAAILAALLVPLPGCSTPAPEPLTAIPPPAFSRELPLEPPVEPATRACKLGTSCMAMDPRPFEICLVGQTRKRCADKALEPIEVQEPRPPQDPEPLEARVGR